MRLILMGTGPFAVPGFERLREAGFEICHVVTRPEVPSAGKKGPPPSPVRVWAEANGLEVYSPDSIKTDQSVQWLKEWRADLMVVCDYGQILSSDCLASTRLGGINLHGSLLPRHRGAAPVQWSILSGDTRAGVSIIHMTPGLDAGPIVCRMDTEIGANENAFQLEARLSRIGADCLLQAMQSFAKLNSGDAVGELQDKAFATKAPRLLKSDGLLKPEYPVRILDRQVRGLQPWPGCFANILFGKGPAVRLLIREVVPIPLAEMKHQSPGNTWDIGEFVYGERLRSIQEQVGSIGASVAIVAADGLLGLKVVQPAGKREMSGDEFVRGYSKMESIVVEPGPSNPLLDKMLEMESLS